MPLLLFQKYPPSKFMYGVATTCSWLGKKKSHYTDLIFNYKCDLDKHLLPQYFRYKKKIRTDSYASSYIGTHCCQGYTRWQNRKVFYKSKIEINEASIIIDKWSFIIKKHVFFRFNFNSTDYSYIQVNEVFMCPPPFLKKIDDLKLMYRDIS